MQITLTKPIEDFISRLLAKGYSDPGEVARQALLRWMEGEGFDSAPPRLLEKLESARNGHFRPYDAREYDAMAAPEDESAR